MPIPNVLKSVYQSHLARQAAQRELHNAKRSAARNFQEQGKLDIGRLKEATAGITHVLEHSTEGKVLFQHGNKHVRISENGPSTWSRFKWEEFSDAPLHLHARNTVMDMLETHLSLARLGGNQTYESLTQNVIALLPAKNIAPTAELRAAMNALNDFVQGRASPPANPQPA